MENENKKLKEVSAYDDNCNIVHVNNLKSRKLNQTRQIFDIKHQGKKTWFHTSTPMISDVPEVKENKFMKDEVLRIKNYWNYLTDGVDLSRRHRFAYTSGKSAKESARLREEANKVLEQKSHSFDEHLIILSLYSASIAAAPKSSEALRVSYFSRSNLFFHIHKYTECIKDIDKALAFNFSDDNFKMKLLYRKTECLINLSDTSATNFIDDVLNQMKSFNMSDILKNHFTLKLEQFRNVSIYFSQYKLDLKFTDEIDFNINYEQMNPNISQEIHIGYSQQSQRGLYTSCKIKPYTFFAFEKLPHAYSSLKVSEIYSHCSHCKKFFWSLIPCEYCSLAMYCSEDCKLDAYNDYHQIECNIIEEIFKSAELKIDSCLQILATKITVKSVQEYNKDIKQLMISVTEMDEQRGSDNIIKRNLVEGKFMSNKCRSVLSLVTNAHCADESKLSKVSKMATKIVLLLVKFTSLFEKSPHVNGIPSLDHIFFVGALISRLYHIILNNSDRIKEERDIFGRHRWLNYNPREQNHRTVEIGFFLSPLCGLINHSCIPNAAYVLNNEGEIILYSVRSIDVDEQICVCYHFLSYQLEVDKRRSYLLMNYAFECSCPACIFPIEWPLNSEAPTFRCNYPDKNLNIEIENVYKLFENIFYEPTLVDLVSSCLQKIESGEYNALIPSQEFYKFMDAIMFIVVYQNRKWVIVPEPCTEE